MEFQHRDWILLVLVGVVIALVQYDPTFHLILRFGNGVTTVIGTPQWASDLIVFGFIFMILVTIALGLRGAVRHFKHGAKYRRIRRARPTFDHLMF